MLTSEQRDRLDDLEQEWFDRRLEELSAGQHWNRAELYAKVQRELDDIRANRNAP